MSRPSPQDFRKRMSRLVLSLQNVVRHVVFGASQGGQWVFEGYETSDGVEGALDEPIDVFQGLYLYARPAADDDAEGIMLAVGAEANNEVIGAVRNEDARLRYVAEFGDIEPGEVALFNSAGTTRVHISAAGQISMEVAAGQQILARTVGGAVEPVVLQSEFLSHGHATAAMGPVSPPIVAPSSTPPATFPGSTTLRSD